MVSSIGRSFSEHFPKTPVLFTSTAIERNFLSHARLALLLSLLSSAFFLDSKFSPKNKSGDEKGMIISLGSLCSAAAVASVSGVASNLRIVGGMISVYTNSRSQWDVMRLRNLKRR